MNFNHSSPSSNVVDLDQAIFFIYPNSEALKETFLKESSDEKEEPSRNVRECEYEFMQRYLKNLWNEIEGIIEPLLVNYFWHDRGLHWSVVESVKSSFKSFLCGKVSFGDGMEDEWFLVRVLMLISERIPDLVISVFDTDGDFLLIEAADVLPNWLEPETSKNRIFFKGGKLHIIDKTISLQQPTLEEALQILQNSSPSYKTVASVPIQNIIKTKSGLKQHLHRTRVRIPLRIAQILYEDEKLIGCAVSAFYNRKAEDMRACTEMGVFNPGMGKSGGPLVFTTIKMTRIHFAQLVCQDFVAPLNEEVDFEIEAQAVEDRIAAEVGMKISCGFKILMNSKEEEHFVYVFPSFAPRQHLSSQKHIKAILEKEIQDSERFICEDPEDDLKWMELDEEDLNSTLQTQMDRMALNGEDQEELLENWTREFEGGAEGVKEEIKREMGEMDEIVEKMKNFIKTSSGFEGIDHDYQAKEGSEVDFDDVTDSDSDSDLADSDAQISDSDAQNSDDDDEGLIERELFETINYDPDLFMKIIEINTAMGADNEDFIRKFRKYQTENGVVSGSGSGTGEKKPGVSVSGGKQQKGLADIDKVKLEEARRCGRKVNFANDKPDDSEDTEEVPGLNEKDTVNDNEQYNDDEEEEQEDDFDEEFIFGNNKKEFSKTTTINDRESTSDDDDFDYNSYSSSMDAELKESLETSTSFNNNNDDEKDLEINLGRSIIEATAAGHGASTSTPIATILTSIGKAVPKGK